ncbi:ribokinase [Alsobacter metallidurans]|uniref:Ribokinase n=1 Tax=Alsobacter metallidurans TaxID=340221 RepID=A0A917I6E1_9HYPH|nr:PfkB family carbohydrate kinase [Alsobacter metallidurans]GGH19328.1 ribokinase [Alsobacter metallidurans]
MSRVFVLGNATLDCIQTIPRLPAPGETLLADSLLRCPGGKGLNQAVACARTGAATVLVAPLGRDADAAVLAAAAAAEPGLAARWMESAAPTDYSAIWVAAGGENMIVSSAAAARGLAEADAIAALDDLRAGDILLLQGNLTREVTMAAARLGRERGARTALNTAPIAWDMAEALALFDIVIANAVEAAQVTGADARSAAAALAPGRIAIVTLGRDGAVMARDGVLTPVAAPRVKAVDTAGAGDVFVGVFVGALCRGAAPDRAIRAATAAAAIAVTRPGTVPSFPSSIELAPLLAEQPKAGDAGQRTA